MYYHRNPLGILIYWPIIIPINLGRISSPIYNKSPLGFSCSHQDDITRFSIRIIIPIYCMGGGIDQRYNRDVLLLVAASVHV